MSCSACGKNKPKILQEVSTFTRAMYNLAKAAARGEEIVANKDLYDYRIRKCVNCYYSAFDTKCSVCGCLFREKAKSTQEKCPKGIW